MDRDIIAAAQMLETLRDNLVNAPRNGGLFDDPEGTRYILISDTVVKYMIVTLDKVIQRINTAKTGV